MQVLISTASISRGREPGALERRLRGARGERRRVLEEAPVQHVGIDLEASSSESSARWRVRMPLLAEQHALQQRAAPAQRGPRSAATARSASQHSRWL